MNKTILPALVLSVLAAPLLAQSPETLVSSFEQAAAGLKAQQPSSIESVKGVPAATASAPQKTRYAMFASIRAQSRELVWRQGDKAVLKFTGTILVRNFGNGTVIADQADVEFREEVSVTPEGNVGPYMTPQVFGVKLYVGEKFIGVGDFDKGSIQVSGKVTDKKVRVSGAGRIWGWVDFVEPR